MVLRRTEIQAQNYNITINVTNYLAEHINYMTLGKPKYFLGILPGGVVITRSTNKQNFSWWNIYKL